MATVVAPKTAANTCSKSRAPVAKRVPLQPCYSAGRHHRCGRRAPNYAEARGAESRADFVHKMAPRDYEMFVAFTGINGRERSGACPSTARRLGESYKYRQISLA